MISKAMVLGAAAAVIATGTGFYISTSGSGSLCNKCIPLMQLEPADESCGGCCGSKVKKFTSAPKPSTVEASTLAACVGGPAYATHSQTITCCTDE